MSRDISTVVLAAATCLVLWTFISRILLFHVEQNLKILCNRRILTKGLAQWLPGEERYAGLAATRFETLAPRQELSSPRRATNPSRSIPRSATFLFASSISFCQALCLTIGWSGHVWYVARDFCTGPSCLCARLLSCTALYQRNRWLCNLTAEYTDSPVA